jgi:hypothetical protein
MKRFLLTFLLLFTIREVQCQKVNGYEYHAAYIPASASENIKIDGNIGEWSWIPKEYKIAVSDLINSEKVTPGDLNARLYVCWSKTKNKVYVLYTVIDDILDVNKLHHDDGLDIYLNPSRQSGGNWSGNNYKFLLFNIFHISLSPASDGNKNYYLHYGPKWMLNKDYFNVGVKTKKLKNGKTISVYEVEIQIFSDLSLFSGQLSTKDNLECGQKIGLTIALNDVDANNLERDVQLRTKAGNNWPNRGEESTLFVLDPPRDSKNLYDELLLLSSQ